MPKQSLEGSHFPALEQERRSTPHPRRTRTERNTSFESPYEEENREEIEKIEESES